MDFRKRRRLFLNPFYSSKLFSLRILFLSTSSFLFLLLLSHSSRVSPTRLLPSTFSHPPSFNSLHEQLPSPPHLPSLRIQSRLLLPDSLLLLLLPSKHLHSHNLSRLSPIIDCVYPHALLPSPASAVHPSLSADAYDDFRWMVRCPLPPTNYSSAVTLQRHLAGSSRRRLLRPPVVSTEVPSWELAVYEAEIDGDIAVIFVKGLNLRPDKEYDPRQFRCRFELGNSRKRVVTATAISAGQEIVRCVLPEAIKKAKIGTGTVKVAIERPRSRQIVPSVARLYDRGGRTQGSGTGSYKYQLCGCTMVWNQAAALREWVAYHAWLGVERWFVYDNNSEDGLGEEIAKLNSENYNMSRHAWPWIKSQEAGFSQCVLRARRECRWVAFFDVDEFFYFPPLRKHRGSNTTSNGTNSTGYENGGGGGEGALKALVAEYSVVPGVGEIRTKCHSFGPSGLGSRPPRGVTVGYTCRLQRPERHKSIVRSEAVDETLLNAVHHFKLRKGYGFEDVPEGRVLINHYKYQVWEMFKAKFSRRVSTYVADWQDSHNENSRDRAPGLGKEAVEPSDWNRWYCEVWDTGLRDFVVANLADPVSGLLPWEASVSL